MVRGGVFLTSMNTVKGHVSKATPLTLDETMTMEYGVHQVFALAGGIDPLHKFVHILFRGYTIRARAIESHKRPKANGIRVIVFVAYNCLQVSSYANSARSWPLRTNAA